MIDEEMIDEEMIDEELLKELASSGSPSPIRPLSEIAARARVLRRQRRTVGATGASLIAGLAVAVAMVGLADLGSAVGQFVQPATPGQGIGKESCNVGLEPTAVQPKDVPELLYLPPKELIGPILGEIRLKRQHWANTQNCQDQPARHSGTG